MPKVELLNNNDSSISNFSGTVILFPKCVHQFAFPPAMHKGFLFLYSLINTSLSLCRFKNYYNK